MILGAFIFFATAHLAFSACPCTVDIEYEMSCDPNSTEHFREDFKYCDFDRSMIRSIQLTQQPFRQLENRSFNDFINLKELEIVYCQDLNTLGFTSPL